MANSIASKKNHSSMQVLKTLLVLMENNYTMHEIVQKLNEKEKEPTFNNSVVSKYINTCRFCGFEINKFYNKYYLSKVPFGLDLTSEDLELIDKFQETARITLTSRPLKKFNDLIAKITKFSNKRISRVQQKTYEITKELFQKAVNEKRFVTLMYRTKTIKHCRPISIIEKDGCIKFNVEYNGKQRTIIIERLNGIEIEENKFEQEKTNIQIVYKIYEPLAQRYDVKATEKLVDTKIDHIVIQNLGEPQDELFSRLLRYDTLCEIVTFKPRQEMKDTISKMLENYGE